MKTLSPFLLASMAVHVFALLALGVVIGKTTSMAGTADGDPDRVFVLVVSEKDRIAVAATPSPVDSPESVQKEKEKPEPEEPETQQRPELLTREEPDSPVLTSDDLVQEIPPHEPEVVQPQEKPKEEQEESLASDPSVASDLHMRRSSLGQELRDFQSRLLAALRQSTFFPQKALKGKRHGEVTVAFAINRNGTVTSVRVVVSSGCKILDDAAQEIVRKASTSFPEFPACVREERLHYTVPIYFRKNRSPHAPRALRTPS